MRSRFALALFVTACPVLAGNCGAANGSTSPGGTGAVQISVYVVNPQSVECALTLTSPPQNTAYPDSVALQATLVNTTHSDVTLISGGSQGTVIRSSAAADIGTSAMTYATLPFRSLGVTVRALDGQVAFTFMLPTIPFCQSKPLHYLGFQDVNMTTRLTASTGSYVTTPQVIHVIWH